MHFSINGVSLGLRRYSVSAFFVGFMRTLKRLFSYFTITEIIIYVLSLALIIASFIIFDRNGYLNMISSLIGVTSLLLCAKGNPIGLVLSIIFSVFYGVISYTFRYYGEMITYVAMTLPMCVLSLISWLKHPYKKRSQVAVNKTTKKDLYVLALLTILVTVSFYFILRAFDTPNLIPSTISVATSFCAVFLSFKRSPYYLIAYALNDIVLIVLWVLASLESISFISVVICFIAFLVNDIYGFINWKKMEREQKNNSKNL